MKIEFKLIPWESVSKFFSVIFNWIKKAFKWMFSDWKNVLIVCFGIALILLYFNFRHVRNELDNVIVSQQDTITVYQNKVGELYSQKQTYITDLAHLKETNTQLAAEVKHLKDNPIVVTKVVTETIIKEVKVTDTLTVAGPSQYTSPIRYTDKWCNIDGIGLFDIEKMTSEYTFNTISFPNTLTLDLIESKKGNLSFIAKSDNPYFQINNIDGVVLSPESSKALKKRFDKKWVFVAGVGASLTIVDSKVRVVPAVQLTFGRKIWAF